MHSLRSSRVQAFTMACTPYQYCQLHSRRGQHLTEQWAAQHIFMLGKRTRARSMDVCRRLACDGVMPRTGLRGPLLPRTARDPTLSLSVSRISGANCTSAHGGCQKHKQTT